MTYNNFNVGKCNYGQCRYAHVCFNCQQNHAVMTCIKSQAFNVNSVPLGQRVTKSFDWLATSCSASSSLIFVFERFPYTSFEAFDPNLSQQGPLKIERWKAWLKNHSDTTYVKTLVGILRKGAKIGYRGSPLNHRNKNHFSALSAPDILTADLQKQLQQNRLAMINMNSEPQFVCSPLRLVSKHDDGWRRIHDLFFPYGCSVNDGISQAWDALKYTTFDEAVDALLQQGRGARLVKRDLKNAFRHISMTSSDQWLLDSLYDNFYWLKRYLLFELRTSSFLFDLFVKDVNWMLIAMLHWFVMLHYLNDFFAILLSWVDIETYDR